MGTDPVLTALVPHRCEEIAWEKTAVKDGFLFYGLPTGEVYRLSKKAVQAKKRVSMLRVLRGR